MQEYWDVYDRNGNVIKGKVSVRGRHDLGPSEYHLVVYVWIINDNDEVIISKRQKGRAFEGSWECTGGCALKGDSSQSAALREVREELGLELDASKGELFKRYLRNYPAGAKAICDVWVFRQSFTRDQLVLQESEVSDAKFISFTELRKMVVSHDLARRYPYINELITKYSIGS